MTWTGIVADYLRDQQATGRINSEHSLRAYRSTLELHGEDSEHGPLEADREDCRRTLTRWEHPNSRARAHTILRSFYDWLQTEGHRVDNPARQVARVKRRATSVYRLTRAEIDSLIAACRTEREHRVVLIGLCTGARVGEMVLLQTRHFERPGWVWFSADIAKGARERWVPVLPDLEPVIRGLSRTPGHYVLSGYRGNVADPFRPCCTPTIARTLRDVAERAGIGQRLHPHLLRHAYGDFIAKRAGLHAAAALMGHASVNTTASVYLARPGLDELSEAVSGLRYGDSAQVRRERFRAQMEATEISFSVPIDRVRE